MNWVVSWVDVSIYPVLAAYYLGYFIPALREGATIGGVFVDSTWLSFGVAIVLIWLVSAIECSRCALFRFADQLAGRGHVDSIDRDDNHWLHGMVQERHYHSLAVPAWRCGS